MKFSEVIGQDHIKHQLRSFVDNDKLPHALMFSGGQGRGGLQLALALTQYIYCENKSEEDACGTCPHCLKIEKLIHPDVHFSYPVVGMNGKKRDKIVSDDFLKEWRKINQETKYFSYLQWIQSLEDGSKKGDINIAECHNIIQKLGLKSFLGNKKILILWLPEFLQKSSNALLKWIEEPTDDTLIIFVTHDLQKLLPTIISRFQIVNIPPIDDEDLATGLSSMHGISMEAAMNIAHAVRGDVAEALQILQEDNPHDTGEEVLAWFRVCYLSKPDLLQDWIQEFTKKGKEQQKFFFKYVLHICQEYIGLQYLANTNNGNYEKFKGLSNVLNADKVGEITELVDQAIFLVDRNINIKIMMMADSLKVGRILRKKEAIQVG